MLLAHQYNINADTAIGHRAHPAYQSSVDKSGLPGKFKAWIYQHGILPRILWPLLVYEVPISTVEGFERRVSWYLQRWLGLSRSLSSIALYGQSNILRIPISSLNEEFMVSRTREVLQYRESSDHKVSQAGIEVQTGREWRAVDMAQSWLQYRALLGAVTLGRTGLGSSMTPRYDKVKGKDRRALIQEEVRASVEEERSSRMVGMRQQGAWMRWEQAVERKISWVELWKAEPHPTSKQIVLLELTVPWEDRIEEANERKRAKYAALVEECQRNRWRARCHPTEVGCRGFAGQSL
ncbi:uncharacterized protein LOC131459868 [Solea solea]|uniref:uncharacterized protein LOC131459868 n=1 Tax=Solea solea TaxID=90069 RepID=UPI002729E243|nr:uncharacterized protein LOC131459868 [Solea solea]